MRVLFVFAVVFMASGGFSAQAEERAMTGAELTEFLPKIRANGSNSSQIFEADGTTEYASAGRPSVGKWSIRGDQYCSVWPPVTEWKCYGVLIDEKNKRIFWVEDNGVREKNRYKFR